MTVDATILPLEEKIEKKYIYVEAVHNYLIPMSKDGKCNIEFYKKIPLDDTSYACVLQKDIITRRGKKLSLFNKKSVFFTQTLMKDPKEYYIILLTRSSAFEFYHNVSKIIKDKGFDVGWYPLLEEEPIKFTSRGGRSIGAQN